MIKKWWWKALGLILLIYTVIVGMAVPLKPGVTGFEVVRSGVSQEDNILFFTPGSTYTFEIRGYNMNLSAAKTKAWLKLNESGASSDVINPAVSSDAVVVPSSESSGLVTFTLPMKFPTTDDYANLTLVLSNAVDGQAILPQALNLQLTADQKGTDSAWSDAYLSEIDVVDSFRFPYRSVLNETIRNTFFHIPLWFSMFIMLIVSLVYSIRYLRTGHIKDDIYASALVRVSVLFGVLGIITGSLWAKYTWGTFWTTDVKLNMSTVAMLIYVASLILRSSINDVDRRAKISASYNIFAFAALIPLVFVIPRLTDSLHPGNGGNPALGGEDMENTLRAVFYPAIIGFTLVGFWIASLSIRYEMIKDNWLTRRQ